MPEENVVRLSFRKEGGFKKSLYFEAYKTSNASLGPYSMHDRSVILCHTGIYDNFHVSKDVCNFDLCLSDTIPEDYENVICAGISSKSIHKPMYMTAWIYEDLSTTLTKYRTVKTGINILYNASDWLFYNFLFKQKRLKVDLYVWLEL